MKYIIFSGLLFLVSFSACRRSDHSGAEKERAVLYERFHGKYKILRATAEQPLDLNFDGMASTDLKEELLNLDNSNLIILLPVDKQINFFGEFWPEPVFGGGNGEAPASYDPLAMVDYANQGVSRTFRFSADRKAMLLEADHAGIDPQRYTRPAAITLLPGNRIEVVKRKLFYTTSGWREVRVVTLYERYTMRT